MHNKIIFRLLFILLIFFAKVPFAYNDDASEFVATDTSEFKEIKSTDVQQFTKTANDPCAGCPNQNSGILPWVLLSLGITAVAGIMVRFKSTRNLRGLFLLVSMLIFGFYRGACPCPISSFEDVFLLISGVNISWQNLIWFLGLIPLTYIFGKVWCGWVCHLGALQEFLFLPGRINWLQSIKAQRILRWCRMILLFALVLQLIITRVNVFCQFDPFKVAFNLVSPNWIGWFLLGLLLLTSLFIYRPFCRTICPIGLVLGWISKIPGASVIGWKNDCKKCSQCSKCCKIHAIIDSNENSSIDNKECIACGNCMDSCKTNSISFLRKNRSLITTIFPKRIS